MVRKPKYFKDEFDYVKVRSLQRFNIDKREWTCGENFPLERGEEAIIARNGCGMQFFFENDGFLEVVDSEPLDSDLDKGSDGAPEPDDEHVCDECGKKFDSSRGVKSHKRQTHQANEESSVDGKDGSEDKDDEEA